MSLSVLPNDAARRLFLHRHALADAPSGPAHGQHLLDLVTRLGFVQLDSINTVARAHDLILFSRRPRYRQAHLKRLYERDRALFEHWTHDAAVIPMAFYPYWELRRQRDAEKLRKQWRSWRRDGFESQFDQVLSHIAASGPVCAADVGKNETRGSGGWWDWHPSKTALEYLWRSGRLFVVGRDGFRKRYDLVERVLDETHLTARPPHEEIVDWCCRSALDRLGFATHGELAAFWAHISPAEARAWCDGALARQEIAPLEVQGAMGQTRKAVAWQDWQTDPGLSSQPPSRLRVLSPFDPALRDRKRAEFLFGFDYRIEIFVPEPKRTYGYYVFPLLERDRVVGRVDMKAHRDRDALVVRALWPEAGVKWGSGRHAAFEAELQRLLPLAGVSTFEFSDGWLRQPVDRTA